MNDTRKPDWPAEFQHEGDLLYELLPDPTDSKGRLINRYTIRAGIDNRWSWGEAWQGNQCTLAAEVHRRWRSHPVLLDALRYALSVLESMPVHAVTLTEDVLDEAIDYDRIKAALKAARED